MNIRIRLLLALAKTFKHLGLITRRDYENLEVNLWLLRQAKKHGLRVVEVPVHGR